MGEVRNAMERSKNVMMGGRIGGDQVSRVIVHPGEADKTAGAEDTIFRDFCEYWEEAGLSGLSTFFYMVCLLGCLSGFRSSFS